MVIQKSYQLFSPAIFILKSQLTMIFRYCQCNFIFALMTVLIYGYGRKPMK